MVWVTIRVWVWVRVSHVYSQLGYWCAHGQLCV